MIYGDIDADSDDEIDQIPFADGEEQGGSLLPPSDDLRSSYQDPNNYWRNVWLYEQRKSGVTNAWILAALLKRGQEFAPLETDNALRSAVASIALYHRWPMQKGRAGRPRKALPEESGNGEQSAL